MKSESGADREKNQTYSLFGLRLTSDYPLAGWLPFQLDQLGLGFSSTTIHFTCHPFPPFPVEWKEGKLIYYCQYRTGNGDLWDKLFQFDNYFVWQFAWGADFYIRNDRVDCHLRNPAYRSLVGQYLGGPIMALWLEREGYPALHASAVTIDNLAAAFSSHSGNGKSTLAAALMQTGASLLSDDILPVENQVGSFWGRPGLPQVNLWPDQASYFTEDGAVGFEDITPNEPKKRIPVEELRKGVFCSEKRPLARIYFPQKYDDPRNSDIEVLPVAPGEAVIELVRHSFLPPYIPEKLGWQSSRLNFFARLVEQVPVCHLRYPSGFSHLPRVAEAVEQDIKSQRLPR